MEPLLQRLIAVSVMVATFMEVIDTSIASVAVPYIAESNKGIVGLQTAG